MRRGLTIAVMMTVVLFNVQLFVCAAHAQEEGKKAMSTQTSEKTSARPSRELREGKTFAAGEVEFLQRPLASQLVTVNPNGTPQLTVMWFRSPRRPTVSSFVINRRTDMPCFRWLIRPTCIGG